MQGPLGTLDDRLGGEVAHEGSEPSGFPGDRAEAAGRAPRPRAALRQRARQTRAALRAAETKRIDFVSLRDLLDLTDGNLSRHIAVLEQAGLVAVEKGFEGKRTRTWVQATKAGRAALHDELAALRELLARVDG